jgi:glycerophosphoryl diester phosphodiesterase
VISRRRGASSVIGGGIYIYRVNERGLRRVGHKGADAIVPGNTIESFAAAVEAGADTIELDVLRPRSDFDEGGDWRRAAAGPARERPGGGRAEPLLCAHDWGDAARRRPSTLAEVLDAFTEPPLDRVELDCDLKVAGREDEIVEALRERGLVDRAMTSTMELSSIRALRGLAPELRVGWTYPRVTRPWDRKRWARPLVLAAGARMRRRLPALAARRIPELGISAVWVYHPLVSTALVGACRAAGVELIAWTVDDPLRMRVLRELGVDGICTNDPGLFAELESAPAPSEPLSPSA